jgi:ribosomal protein S18 acetylase RimI-like enzyme
MQLRQVPATDVSDFLARQLSTVVARRGELVDALARPAIAAYDGDDVIGVLTYDIVVYRCEVVTLHAAHQWHGVGTALLAAAAQLAEAAGCRDVWLVTTNDNVDALRFYQRRGFRIVAIRPGAVDDARRMLKPQIPVTGEYGIALRDEIELVLQLPETQP